MAKVITFSRVFPKTHPRRGEPTFFVEQILKQKGVDWTTRSYLMKLILYNQKNLLDGKLTKQDLIDFQKSLIDYKGLKKHTIRNGCRFREGDWFSPRVWSGRPYFSPQIIFLPNTQVMRIWDFQITNGAINSLIINYRIIHNSWQVLELALNDGLSLEDFEKWFFPLNKEKYKGFSGQIICWDELLKDKNY